MSEGRPRPALFELPLDDATPPSDALPRKATVALDAPEVSANTALVEASSIVDEAPEIAEATEEDLTGTVVAGYRVEYRLGGGGFADVYQGRHQYLPRVVAIKVLRRVLTASAPARRRFSREAEVLGALDHPNVVKLIDFGVLASGRPFLITEKVEGETLRARLDSPVPVASNEAWAWVRQLALGLQAMHGKGVVHRDLKPTNVMIDAHDATLRILDLGIARWMEPGDRTRLTEVGRLLGTPMYAAPEQLVDASSAGPEADMYAVGAMLYEMVAGRPPYFGERQAVIAAKMLAPPPLPDGNTGLEEIAVELMHPDPRARIPTADALLARLDAAPMKLATVLLTPPPGHAATPAVVPSIPSPRASSTRVWMFALVAVGTAFVVGVMAGVAGRDESVPVVMAPAVPVEDPPPPAPPPRARAAPVVQPEIEAVEEPAPADERAADVRAAAADSRQGRPRPAKPVDEAKLVRDVDRALAKRNLLPTDIDLAVDTTAWRAALASGEGPRAEAATRALVRAIEEAPIQEPLVSARIRRLLTAARDTSARRSQSATQSIEDRCFELRRALRGAGASERADILREVVALERRLVQ